MNKDKAGGEGPAEERKDAGASARKEKASLMNSANKLFSTGFVESVLNQKMCSTLGDIEVEWANKRIEAQEQRYLESARRLDRMQKEEVAVPFQPENLDFLIQNFVHRDTESTIRLNSSLGQFGEEILGDTFRRD